MFNMLPQSVIHSPRYFPIDKVFTRKSFKSNSILMSHTAHRYPFATNNVSSQLFFPENFTHFITLQVILRNTCYPQVAQFVRKITFPFPRRRSLSSVLATMPKNFSARIAAVYHEEERTICRGSPNDNDAIFQMQLLFLASRGLTIFLSPVSSCGKPARETTTLN